MTEEQKTGVSIVGKNRRMGRISTRRVVHDGHLLKVRASDDATIACAQHTSGEPNIDVLSLSPEETGIKLRKHLHVRVLALHDVSRSKPGSHFGSPLKPGRSVLTLGVSRRREISGLCSCRSLT